MLFGRFCVVLFLWILFLGSNIWVFFFGVRTDIGYIFTFNGRTLPWSLATLSGLTGLPLDFAFSTLELWRAEAC
jgi:hypothetical protein